jgi:HrpA-like RNA helicase
MSRFGFLLEKPDPEIARIENALSLLEIAEYVNLEKLSDVSLNLLHPLPHSLFTSHLNDMIDMGLFTPISTELTALGRHLNSLELPVWLGKLVFNGIFLRCLDPSIIIAAFLICGNPVFKDGLKNATFSFKAECSDHMCLLEVYKMWTDAKVSFSRKSEEMKFCDNHNFSHSILTLITKTVNQIRGIVISSGILVSAAELFNRIIGPQKHKEAYLDFFNENTKKQSLIKGLLLTGLYPEFGISKPESWKVVTMIKKDESFDISPNLADWGPMDRIKRNRDATEAMFWIF